MVAGCSDSSESDAVPTTTTAPQETENGGDGETAPSSVSAVHYTELMAFLPSATANWVEGEKTGMMMASGGQQWSWAEATYTQTTNPDVEVTVIIQDTAGMKEGYWAIWDTATMVETPEFSWKSTSVEGYPAWEFTDKIDEEYILYVGIDDRFIVYIDVANGKKDILTVFSNMIDYGGIAAL
ncbi:hypothetical protein CUJ86_08250 [Methanofollis fontis]|uniref:Uncharacterized protein n=2 Tax=Methanofollis fontis TaxID=2052832 RepID=A0A483CTJ7_9EURY|nr:hypothetical protein CUJ86_08250 [Methanofollis fontis]